MLKQINALLKSFKNKPISNQLEEKSWLQIVFLYTQCSMEHQDFLISELSQCFTIPKIALHNILVLFNRDEINNDLVRQTLADFREAQIQAESKRIVQFKRLAIKHIPALELYVTHNEWLELNHLFKKSQRKYLGSAFLINELSRIRDTNYHQFTGLIAKKMPPRLAKMERAPAFVTPLRSCKHRYRSGESENRLIFQAAPDNEYLHDSMRATGARIEKLAPATPEKGYRKLKKTPGGSKVRPYFINSYGCFFKHLTPYGDKTQSGMVNLSQRKPRRIPALVFTRPEKTHFIATLEKLRNRANPPKKISPTRYTGVRCHDIFKAYGSEEHITISGNDYHWSHLIAEFLGGGQLVIPGTAASNYNTLEIVERFIANKLIHDEVEAIEIEVTCKYSGETLIPDELIFNLYWEPSCFEIIHINPRSYQRITDSMHKSIALLRSIKGKQGKREPLSAIDNEELNFDIETLGYNKDFEGIFPLLDSSSTDDDISEDILAIGNEELDKDLDDILSLEDLNTDGEDISSELYSSPNFC